MSPELQRQLIEDVSYLRGRFDSIIPEIQRANSSVNQILILHQEKIDRVEKEQLSFKTKVGVYGSLAGIAGSGIMALIIGVVQHYLFTK